MISPAEMVTNPARCPRCSGQLYRELADEYCCLACGEYVFVARRRLTATAHPTTSPHRAAWMKAAKSAAISTTAVA
jgi:DNA-directed RNA polymerase subunit RPC12/RpoP